MTYRDFTPRQIKSIQRKCEDALKVYAKTHPEPIDREAFQAAFSRAFILGVNHLEKKYAHVGLFDEAKG